MMSSDAPILVVGGRTTGLTMACELARHGVPVRIVDKSPGIDPHCRATVLHSRTLEVFQDLGIVEEIMAAGVKVRGVNQYANGRRFLHVRYDGVDSPYPWAIALEQCTTEAALQGLLKRLGVTVERRTELVAFAEHPDGGRATLKHADGREEIVVTPWLIGCDGAHSSVRHLNREQFPGEQDSHQWVLADVMLDAPVAHEEAHGFLSDHGASFLFPLPGGRTLIAADLPELHDGATETPTLERIQALLDERGPARARVSNPRWLTYFRIHYRLAPHYRHGRTFLAGDAAHIHSLLGGQGMNTGIQDAYNLAWKLALVTRGRAPDSLLESYERERRAVAEDVVATTKRMTDQAEGFGHLSAAEREKLYLKVMVAEPERLRMGQHREELDLDYRKSPICAESAGGPGGGRIGRGPHAGAQAPDAGPLQMAERTATLYELLQGTRHTLLLFAGTTPARTAHDLLTDLSGLATSVGRRHGDIIDTYIIVPTGGADASLQASVVRDPEQNLHRRYDAENECLYLIRPDGYVGYRCEPATMSNLQQYLERVF